MLQLKEIPARLDRHISFLLSLAGCISLVVCLLGGCRKDSSAPADNTGITPAKPYDSTSLLYFVDGSSGNDANTGKAVSAAWKTIQKACDNATPGSYVMIKGGMSYNEALVVNVSGTPEHPIMFAGYGAQDPVLDGTGQAGMVMLSLTNTSYLSFNHLVIQNLTANGAQGIAVTATDQGLSTDLSFHHLTIRKINWTADLTKTPGSNDNAQPFIVYGRGLSAANAVLNLKIDSSLIEDNTTGFSECLSLDGNISGFTLSDNTVQNNSNIGIAVIGNYGTSRTASLDQARNGRISHNTCVNNLSAYATSGGIYADGAKDVVIERNYCSANGYGIEIGCEENGSASGVIVAGNLLLLNQVAGLAIGGYNPATTGQVTDCLVYNNSFFKNNSNGDGTGEVYLSKASRCLIRNNLFITNGQKNLLTADAIRPQSDNIFDYNDWFSPTTDIHTGTISWQGTVYNSFEQYRHTQQQESYGLLADPLVINAADSKPDMHLSASSPIRGKGNAAAIQPAANLDFDGNPLSNAGSVSIGAFR